MTGEGRLITALILLLAAQATWAAAGELVPTRYAPIEMGERLPRAITHPTRDVEWNPCEVGYFCRVSCVWCGRAAARYAELSPKERASLPRANWIVLGDERARVEFREAHGLPDSLVYSVPAKWGTLPPTILDIPVTPLRVVWSGNGRVRDLAPVQRVPSEDELSRVCRSF